jgi:hypothetical protein
MRPGGRVDSTISFCVDDCEFNPPKGPTLNPALNAQLRGN